MLTVHDLKVADTLLGKSIAALQGNSVKKKIAGPGPVIAARVVQEAQALCAYFFAIKQVPFLAWQCFSLLVCTHACICGVIPRRR